MATPGQYIVDFTSADALAAALNEYFAVGVIPVASDAIPKVMNPVKLQVMLPMERELFFTGIVIMQRPGGFLVQCDTPPNMQFLHDTLRDHALAAARESAHAREQAPQSDNLRDEFFTDAATDALRTTTRTERMGAISTPANDEVRSAAAQPVPERGGTMVGHIDPRLLPPDDFEKPTAGRQEKTRPGIRKSAPRPAQPVQAPADDDEFSISSITAVDAVTGQAKPIREKTGQHKRAPFETREFGRDGEEEVEVQVFPEQGAARGTARQEYRDVPGRQAPQDPERTIRMKPVNAAPRKQASPLDELFELASTAGAPGIVEDQFGDAHIGDTGSEPENLKTQKMRPGEFEDEFVPAEDSEMPTPPEEEEPEPFDDEKSGPLDRELAVSIREMTTPEKQRLARQGKRVARRILIRDNDKTIHKFVFFNPDLKLDEVVEYTRSNSLASDAIEFICTNRQWMDSHDVVLNIVRNNSTPIELAVRLVIKLTQNDWRMLARPGVVRPPVMNQARRLLQGIEAL